ncbi:hypothetical protein GWI33_005543 [Rhynchophorus ferrugineus]|uniref:Uncharacterized protein n=1 Tax=Rhynchophorus ferrugineus TaxID=354439 RepID=A0A834IMS4_RHYFE|nr:hypothetical protein GWI33_005543 [Rhynchophorus ferrugineus]
MWKPKIRDLLDYHEGALDAIDGKLVKPGAFAADADDKMVTNHKVQSDLYKFSDRCCISKNYGQRDGL